MRATPFLILLTCLLWGRQLLAQADSTRPRSKRHELGMNLYDLAVRGGDFNSRYKRVWDHYLLGGLYYKRYYGKNVLRMAAGYQQKLIGNKSYYNYNPNNGTRALSSRNIQLSLGYQRLLGGKRVTPYLSCDAGIEHTRELRTQSDQILQYYTLIAPYPQHQNSMFTRLLFGVSPGLGLRFHLGRGIMLTTEVQAQLFYAIESGYYAPYGKMIGVNLKPMTCSLGFMF